MVSSGSEERPPSFRSLKNEIDTALNIFKRREQSAEAEAKWQELLDRRPGFLKEEEQLFSATAIEQSILETQTRIRRQQRHVAVPIENIETQLLNPSSDPRTILAALETREMPVVSRQRQTEQIVPIVQKSRPQITDSMRPIRRTEYSLAHEPLSDLMAAAALHYAALHDVPPSAMLMSRDNYTIVLPMLQCLSAYERGFPLDTEGTVTIPYGVDTSLDNHTVACVGPKTTHKL